MRGTTAPGWSDHPGVGLFDTSVGPRRKSVPDLPKCTRDGPGMTCFEEPPDGQVGLADAICLLIGDTLGVENVTPDEDFFELGGTSLQAATLIAQIERRLGSRLSLADFYESPTAAGLTARMNHTRPPLEPAGLSAVWLAPPQPGLDGAPLVLIHLIHAGLAREIGRRRPVLGLSYGVAVDGDAPWPGPTAVEALAAHYVAELRSVCPTGPYHLAGHCARGAAVAWEVARQLQDAGAEVGAVCLVDGARTYRWVGWRTLLRNAAPIPPRLLARIVLRFALRWCLRLVEGFVKASPDGLSKYSDPQSAPAPSDRAHRRKSMELQHLDAYHALPLRGRLVFIEAVNDNSTLTRLEQVPLSEYCNDRRLCPDGQVRVQVPCDHRALFRESMVQRVAEVIEKSIQAHES